MKVSRQNIYESYNTTSDWLSEFERGIVKSADYLDNLKHIMNNRKNKFATIEEKMADIKERVGFEMIKHNQLPDANLVSQAGCGCDNKGKKKSCCSSCEKGMPCEGCSTKNTQKRDSDVKKMEQILKFIDDMVSDQPHLNPVIVISKCREEDGLGFDDLPIDTVKLNDYIKNKRNNKEKDDEEEVLYISDSERMSLDSAESLGSELADYFSHANV